jgi:hypothetical protein
MNTILIIAFLLVTIVLVRKVMGRYNIKFKSFKNYKV